MELKRILERLVRETPGGRSAILVDWEGEAVVSWSNGDQDDYDVKVMGAHHGILLEEARRLCERLDHGETREIQFCMSGVNVVTAPVNREYFLVMSLEPRRHPVLARPLLRRALMELALEIG